MTVYIVFGNFYIIHRFFKNHLTLIETAALMPYSIYRALPLETLHNLLESYVRDMLIAFETKQDNMIPFKAMKRQVKTLLDIIEEKKKENLQKN